MFYLWVIPAAILLISAALFYWATENIRTKRREAAEELRAFANLFKKK